MSFIQALLRLAMIVEMDARFNEHIKKVAELVHLESTLT